MYKMDIANDLMRITPNTMNLHDFAKARSQLFVRPISWSSVNPSAGAIKKNATLVPSIQMFGYTPDGRTAYVRLPRKSTFILTFAEEVDDDMIDGIYEILNPIYVKTSVLDNKILIVRAPELSPIELTANPDFEGLATWTNVEQDPYGELESLWEAREIGPYEWIVINKFVPLPGKYTSCDLNLTADETNIESAGEQDFPDITSKLFFWDIETFASKPGEFPNSSNAEDVIFMVSIITVSRDGSNHEMRAGTHPQQNSLNSNAYVIVKGNVAPQFIKEKSNNVVIIRVKDEKELISQFFAIYNTFGPDRQIYYNGDMFDMPYLLNRLTFHDYEIPRITKITTLVPKTIWHRYPTPFGSEMAQTVLLPGTEIIDLLHYYRRFYPNFNSHRLDVVSQHFLKEGKADLTIDEMMDAVRTDDPTKISKVIDYSYVDSLRMYQLWNTNEVQSRLETVCNNLGISIDTLLRKSFDEIIDRTAFNVDAGTAVVGGSKAKPSHLKDAVKGIYRNVFIYDYSELYRQLMISSDQPIAAILGDRLEGAPPALIVAAFYSKYVDRTELLPSLNSMLDSVIGKNTVIALESTIIRSISRLDANWLQLVDTISSYISVAKASYIVLDDSGEMETAGLAKLCRPKFELAAEIVQQYITRVYGNTMTQFSVPKLEEQPPEKFILTQKIGDIITLAPDSLKYKLASQYGSPISTWVTVKYIMMVRGPVLLSQIQPTDVIDYNYYTAELGKYLKDLQSLKVYGV
ncbi:DNA polymerase family B [uncultured virus]|nr:DNA polymerase family B [uncultured virus]